jgi:hypothetical protein
MVQHSLFTADTEMERRKRIAFAAQPGFLIGSGFRKLSGGR